VLSTRDGEDVMCTRMCCCSRSVEVHIVFAVLLTRYITSRCYCRVLLNPLSTIVDKYKPVFWATHSNVSSRTTQTIALVVSTVLITRSKLKENDVASRHGCSRVRVGVMLWRRQTLGCVTVHSPCIVWFNYIYRSG